MGLIQVDVNMPKCCDDCFALDDHGDYPFCLISQDQRGYTFNTREKRMPTCPLKEQESVEPSVSEYAAIDEQNAYACRLWQSLISTEREKQLDAWGEAYSPRLLTAIEYKSWCVSNWNRNKSGNMFHPKTPLLIEKRNPWGNYHEMYWLNSPEGVIHVDEEYGKSFVVWTGWPSDEQRKAVKWE